MAEENKTVDMSTDDLDDFNDLWEGRASETPKEEPAEEVEEEVETDEAEEAEEEIEEVNDDDDSVATEEEEPKAKPKKNSAQERIDELTKARREAEREAKAVREELERLRQKQNEPKEQEETKEPETESEAPDHTDKDKYPLGDLDPQYLADRQDYMLEKRIAELDAQRAKQEANREAQARAEAMQDDWNAKLAAAEEKHEDYRETVQSLQSAFEGVDPESGQFIAETIMGMETGTDVLYHLAKNPALAREIATQSPVNAALALGRLEAGLATPTPAKPARRQSKAPEPPKGLNKGTATSTSVKPDTDDLDAFEGVFFDKK